MTFLSNNQLNAARRGRPRPRRNRERKTDGAEDSEIAAAAGASAESSEEAPNSSEEGLQPEVEPECAAAKPAANIPAWKAEPVFVPVPQAADSCGDQLLTELGAYAWVAKPIDVARQVRDLWQ